MIIKLPMDVTQAILLSVIVVLAIFLVFLGIQVFFVLKDFRLTLRRVNRLFDNLDELSLEIKKPISSLGNIFTALTAGAGIAHLFKRLEDKREREK